MLPLSWHRSYRKELPFTRKRNTGQICREKCKGEGGQWKSLRVGNVHTDEETYPERGGGRAAPCTAGGRAGGISAGDECYIAGRKDDARE